MNTKKSIKFNKVLVSVIAAFVMAFLLAFFVDGKNVSIICNAFNFSADKADEYTVPPSLMISDDLDLIENVQVTKKSNPEIHLKGINRYVKALKICYSYYDWQQIGVTVYWNKDTNESFSDDLMRSIVVNEDDPYILFYVEDYMADVKIILGLKSQKKINIEKVIVNPDLKSDIITDTVKTVKNRFRFITVNVERFKIFLALFLVLSLPVWMGWKRVFDYRWVIGGLFLLYVVLNNYNGDSMGCYDYYVQPGYGNEYVRPIVGKLRHIRSDEWGEHTTTYMSTMYLDDISERDNYIIRGTDSVNEYAVTWYSIYDPFNFIAGLLRKIIGFDKSYSFRWYSRLIFSFLINIEFFLLITKDNKLLSFAASSMIILSSFYQWWYFPAFATALPALFVYAHGFLHSTVTYKKVLNAIGAAIFAGFYALNLYPAWQVPIGYLIIALAVWFVVDNIEEIKKINRKDVLIILATMAFIVAMIVGFISDRMTYITAMMNTIYPGKRFSSGGMTIQRIFNYIAAALFPFRDASNASNDSSCISLFPIPFIFAIYYQVKYKKKNVLLFVLTIYTAILLVFTTVGFPAKLSTITLMSYVTGKRAIEVLSYSEVLLFAALFSVWKKEEKFKPVMAGAVALAWIICSIYIADRDVTQYMTNKYKIFAFVLLGFAAFALISNVSAKYLKASYFVIILFAIITGVYVRPISKGLESITSKPLYENAREIIDRDPKAKWISQGTCLCNYMVACGAPSIDFCNLYPNLKLWEMLDPTGEYSECYNRMFYPYLAFTDEETTMSNPQPDVAVINLSYKDMKKTEVKYVASVSPLDIDNEYVRFDNLYESDGGYIYKVLYK